MKTSFSISDAILKWVLKVIDYDDVSQENINLLKKWLASEKTPTYNQILEMSRATGVPLGYFFLKEPPLENTALLDFRTVDSVGNDKLSRNLLAVIHDMKQVQEWYREYILDSKGMPNKFVGIANSNIAVNDYCASIRNLCQLELDWFRDLDGEDKSFKLLRERISGNDIIVMMNGVVGNNNHRKLNLEEFRAFTLIDEYAPLIFINANDSVKGRVFSLIHELAHIGLGQDSLFNDRSGQACHNKNIEQLCNAVAAEILVPNSIFEKKWLDNKTNNLEQKIETIAKFFKCSVVVVARKALDFGFIKIDTYNKVSAVAISGFKKKNKSGGNFYATAASRIDHRFFNMLSNSVDVGKTLYTDAFRLTNTNRITFDRLRNVISKGESNGY